MTASDSKKAIEAILFVAAKPVNVKEIALTLGAPVGQVAQHLDELSTDYTERGLVITKKGDHYQLASSPDQAKIVMRFMNEELRGDLSKAALEVLAIVFYKRPVTRMEIEEIRGVSSAEVLRQLMLRGLVAEVGRKEALGRPILYGTTLALLHHFGVEREDQIPDLNSLLSKAE